MATTYLLTKQAIRSLKSLLRDNDERELYKHEFAAIRELEDARLGFLDDEWNFGLTEKGKKVARALGSNSFRKGGR